MSLSLTLLSLSPSLPLSLSPSLPLPLSPSLSLSLPLTPALSLPLSLSLLLPGLRALGLACPSIRGCLEGSEERRMVEQLKKPGTLPLSLYANSFSFILATSLPTCPLHVSVYLRVGSLGTLTVSATLRVQGTGKFPHNRVLGLGLKV